MNSKETRRYFLPQALTLLILTVAGCLSEQETPAEPPSQPTPTPISRSLSQETPTTAIELSPLATPTPEPTATPEIKPLRPRFIDRGNPARPEIALTFDGGAGSTHTAAILDILKEKNVKATMFLTGQWMEQNPTLVRRMVVEGHQIANHSWDHPDFRNLNDDQIRWQLSKTEEKAQELTGKSTKPYFRPPYGGYDQRVINLVAQEGYTQFIYWTYDSGDWIDDLAPQQIATNVVGKAANGAIVVMHLNSWQEPRILAQIIDDLIQKRGLRPNILEEVIKD